MQGFIDSLIAQLPEEKWFIIRLILNSFYLLIYYFAVKYSLVIQNIMESSAYYRLNYDNSKIANKSSNSDFVSSDLNTDRSNNVEADWKNRIKQKNSCTVFRKRSQSGIAKTTEMSTENLDSLSVIDLKEQLNCREKYLQNLI